MIYSKQHREALNLQKKLKKIDKDHEKFVKEWTIQERTPGYSKKEEAYYSKKNDLFDRQSDVAYSEYYNYMHKNFNYGKNGDRTYTDRKKYKDGFTDRKYINKMFQQKYEAERIKRQKTKERQNAQKSKRKRKK